MSTTQKKFGTKKWRTVYAMTGGRCYYCGLPLSPDSGTMEDAHGRDWLLPQFRQSMAADHKMPAQRGGSNDIENLNPACGSCNSRKGLSSVDEYRLRLGLQTGVMPYRFACDPLAIDRDFIAAVSPAFVRKLIIHNFPDAYEHRRGTR